MQIESAGSAALALTAYADEDGTGPAPEVMATLDTNVGECGDGELSDVEQCDDGNLTAGDGCSATCAVEPGYACHGEPRAALQDGDLACPDPVEFAYYAVYNFFRKYALNEEVDDWLIGELAHRGITAPVDAPAATETPGAAIEDSVFTGTRGWNGALILEGYGAAVVEGNQFVDNAMGIKVENATSTIRDNTFRGNGEAIWVTALGDPNVEANTIEGNVVGIRVDAHRAPSIVGNRICDNETDLEFAEPNAITLSGNTICSQ